MFSDRFWILKLALALGAMGWLCQNTRKHVAVREPDVELVAFSSEALRDHTYFVWAKQVRSSDPAGFEVPTKVGPMRILSPVHPPVGAYVSIKARPTGPRTLEAVQVDIHSGYVWKRPLNYAISILTVVGYLWLIRRRFRWRMAEGVFRSRY